MNVSSEEKTREVFAVTAWFNGNSGINGSGTILSVNLNQVGLNDSMLLFERLTPCRARAAVQQWEICRAHVFLELAVITAAFSPPAELCGSPQVGRPAKNRHPDQQLAGVGHQLTAAMQSGTIQVLCALADSRTAQITVLASLVNSYISEFALKLLCHVRHWANDYHMLWSRTKLYFGASIAESPPADTAGTASTSLVITVTWHAGCQLLTNPDICNGVQGASILLHVMPNCLSTR